MKPSLVVATLLCFTTWMTTVHASYGPVKNCCVVWSKTIIPLNRIVTYVIQSEDTCTIKAVQLRTVLGKTICANPNTDWTRRAVQMVDKKKEKVQEKRPKEEGSACDMTPVASAPTRSKPTSTPSTSAPTTSTPTTSKPTSPSTTSKPTSTPTTSKPTSPSTTSKPTSTPSTSTPTTSPSTSTPTTSKLTSTPSTSTPTTSPSTSTPTTSKPTSQSTTSTPTTSTPKGSTKSKNIPLTKDRRGKRGGKKARRGNKKQYKCV